MSQKIYVRKWPCAVCGDPVRLEGSKLYCKCGSIIYTDMKPDIIREKFDVIKEYDL